MQESVTQAEPERQLAEISSQAIARKWQSIAIMPHQMRSQERLRLLISDSKERFRASSECAEQGGMRVPQVCLRGIRPSNSVAPAHVK